MCQVDWRSGHVSGAVYGAVNEELCDVAGQVYCQHMWANPLHPDLFPNIRKMEAEVRDLDHGWLHCGPEQKKHRKNSHLIIHCPTSEGVSEVSERASERSGAREQSNAHFTPTLISLSFIGSNTQTDRTSRTEFGQQMRFHELPVYLSLNRLLNGALSYS